MCVSVCVCEGEQKGYCGTFKIFSVPHKIIYVKFKYFANCAVYHIYGLVLHIYKSLLSFDIWVLIAMLRHSASP